MAAAGPLQPGYGNGGLEPMKQFDKLSEKMTNSLKNLEFTRDMLHQLAESEKKSAQTIAMILNKKNKNLRFSVVDTAVQNYWKKQEANRRHFSTALQKELVEKLDAFISQARTEKKKLAKENGKVQNSFIQCKKESEKQKQRGETEWQKLEDQIRKNENHKKTNKMSKVKDLKNLQEKCSKAFARYEGCIVRLNDLEKENHRQACSLGKLLHESQKHAADRLALHFKMAVSTKKFCEQFIGDNQSIVQSKAPPVEDVLWRWLSYPKNHHTHALPCSSQEVFRKEAIGQSFRRNVEPDYQTSPFLKPPKVPQSQSQSPSNAKKTKPSKSSAPSSPSTGASSSQPSPNHKKRDKKSGNKKAKKPKHKQSAEPQPQSQSQSQTQFQPQSQAQPQSQSNLKPDATAHGAQPSVSENWANFGADDEAPGAAAAASNDMFSAGNAMSDEDFFGAASNGDVFGSEPGQQDNAQNGTEQKQNGDSFGFGDDAGFGFGDDADDVFGAVPGSKSEVTTEHKEAPNTRNEATDPQTQGNGAFDGDFAVNFGGDEAPIPPVHDDGTAANGGGFDSTNWNTSFGDDDAFAGHIEEKPQQNGINADDDQLFAAADDVGDIWGSPDDVPAATTGKKEEEKHGLFDDNFGDDFGSGDVVFADDNGAEMKQNVVSPDPPNMDDPMFGGNDPEFPNFGASISEINGASDVDAGGDGLFDDDFDDDDAAVEFPEFDVSAATKPQRVEAVGDAVPSAVSPSPNEITSIPEPVIKFEASPLPNMSAVPESTSNNITDEVDADNPFGVDPFGASGSSGDDHLEDDDDIDADNPFAMFDEPDQDGGNVENENVNGGADDDFDPFS